MDDVGAVIGKDRAGLMSHGVDDAEQSVGESHAGHALGIMHLVAGIHILAIGFDQVLLDHLDGMDRKSVRIRASGCGDIGLDRVSQRVHTSVGDQLDGHGMSQLGINDSHIGCDLEISQRILNAFFIIRDDGEGSDLGRCAGSGRDRAEMRFFPELGDSENLAHLLKGDLRILVFDPHRLCGIDGRTSADRNDPVGLKLQHLLCSPHDSIHGGIRFDALKDPDFHPCFLQILLRSGQEAEALHGAAADTDNGLFPLQPLESFQSIFSMIYISG